MRTLFILLISTGLLHAQSARPGTFDYYVLALSWSPTWCALEGRARNAPQCVQGTGRGWVLHGLWPQYERGWPSNCTTTARSPSRAETAEMADIMGSSGVAWHQWRKHGRCTGLSAADYFSLSRRAWESIHFPPAFADLRSDVRLSPRLLEQAFIQANPGLSPDMITVTCRSGRVQEVRLCLTRSLEPRSCAPDAARDCSLPSALLPAAR